MTIIKDPGDVDDYPIDWGPWLAKKGGDTIATSTWVVPVGITKTQDTHDTTSTTAWFSGGTLGEKYTVTNHVTTAGGRQKDRSFTILIDSE